MHSASQLLHGEGGAVRSGAYEGLWKTVNSIAATWALQVQSTSSSHVALVLLLLREWAFAGFKATDPPLWK